MEYSSKYALLGVFVVLLVSSPVMAVHVHGEGGFVSVATDGFDDGYYLVVWSNSSGVFGRLYHVVNNSPAGDVIQMYDSGAYVTAIASSKLDNTESADNLYLVAWKADDGYPYVRFLNYDGGFMTAPIRLNYQVGKTIGVAYGIGHFVVIYEGYPDNSKLYYAIFNKDGTLVEQDSLYDFAGAVNTPKIAYDPSTRYFGVFLGNEDSNGNSDASFLAFNLNKDGTLNKEGIQVTTVLDNVETDGRAISPSGDGFIIAYHTTSYRWYTREVSISESGISIGREIGPFYIDGDTAYNGGAMDLVYNGSSGLPHHIVFVYENKRGSDNVYEIVVQLLNTAGEPLNGNYNGDHIIQGGKASYRSPAVAAKPFRSPAAYIISWSDTSLGQVEGSEYLSTDFSEVSPTNEVPFFSNVAIGILALMAVVLFRRK